MDILESRMLLAAGIISSQSWQLPAPRPPGLTVPVASSRLTVPVASSRLTIAVATHTTAVYTVPGTDSRLIVEPISVVNKSTPSAAPTFGLRILSYSTGSPVEQYIVSTPANATGTANSRAGSLAPVLVSHSSSATGPAVTPQGSSKPQAVPWSQEVKVSGTVAHANDSPTWSIPVGPQTSLLKVDVTSGEDPEDPVRAAVYELDLVSNDGSLLASMQGVAAATASQGPHQDFNIDLSNIPTGAQLLMRLVASPGLPTPLTTPSSSSSSTSAASTSAPASTTTTAVSVSYKMEVQRSDPPVTMVTIGAAYPFGSPASSPSNGLIVPGNLLGSGSTALASSAARASAQQPADGWLVGKPEEAQAPEAVPDRAADQNGLSAPEISVGPLASRGSAPLGPLLGTIQGDRTQSIDRDERAFDLAMEQLGSGVGLEIAIVGPQVQTGSVGRESTDPEPLAPRDASGSLIPLRGTGGFPVLVSSSGATQTDSDATALLATLPVSSLPGASADDPALELYLTPLTLSEPEEQASDDAARTDFLTSACGLVLGVGLATGPLYPDLIGLVRTCLPRAVRPPGKIRRNAGRGNHPLQKFMSWLRLSRG